MGAKHRGKITGYSGWWYPHSGLHSSINVLSDSRIKYWISYSTTAKWKFARSKHSHWPCLSWMKLRWLSLLWSLSCYKLCVIFGHRSYWGLTLVRHHFFCPCLLHAVFTLTHLVLISYFFLFALFPAEPLNLIGLSFFRVIMIIIDVVTIIISHV